MGQHGSQQHVFDAGERRTFGAIVGSASSGFAGLPDVSETIVPRVDLFPILAMLQFVPDAPFDILENLGITDDIVGVPSGDDNDSIVVRMNDVARLNADGVPPLAGQSHRDIDFPERPEPLIAHRGNEGGDDWQSHFDELLTVTNSAIGDNAGAPTSTPTQTDVAADHCTDFASAGGDNGNAAFGDTPVHGINRS